MTKAKDTTTTNHKRSISASEVARNLRHFETWSTHQGCEQVAFSDLPIELKGDVTAVFKLDRQLPYSWIDDSLPHLTTTSPELLKFIRAAQEDMPTLFSRKVKQEHCIDLFSELHSVYLAWRRLQWMRNAKEKWSEADFAANVYNVFRSPAVRESAYRTQCDICLPRPAANMKLNEQAARVLKPRAVVPDCAIFARANSIRHLSLSRSSPYKVLNSHPAVKKRCGRAVDSTSFRFQSTPCAQLPDVPCFEFASSFWEDKKPNYELLEHAYRQNRMATAAALRQLDSLHIRAPVFGLVWSNGVVRAHVDWCVREGKSPAVYSAPYPGPNSEDHGNPIFHEWNLDRPCDILQVYLFIRNLDTWTAGRFRERIESGLANLVNSVVQDDLPYRPWRYQAVKVSDSENTPPASSCKLSSASVSTSPEVAEKKLKSGARRVAKESKPLRQLNRGR